jgi:hypothetical protein
MSFSFTAAGTAAEVANQLEVTDTYGNEAGAAVAKMVTEQVKAAEPASDHLSGDWKLVYVVKASGHSGPGAALSLNLTVEALYVRDLPSTVTFTDTGQAEALA